MSFTKGMPPIEKNIQVVDEQGNIYEATYPKRAKGLVKNGRARFINENTICLACPPEIMEDKTMSNDKNGNAEMNTPSVDEQPKEKKKVTINYILEQIEAIAKNQDYLNDALQKLTFMESKGPGDVGTQGQAEAISKIVEARETTNQKLIALYEKMYEDLMPKPKCDSERIRLLKTVIKELGEGMTPIESKEALKDILGVSLQDLTKNI